MQACVVPPSLGLGEALSTALSTLDSIFMQALQIHVLEPVPAVKTSLKLARQDGAPLPKPEPPKKPPPVRGRQPAGSQSDRTAAGGGGRSSSRPGGGGGGGGGGGAQSARAASSKSPKPAGKSIPSSSTRLDSSSPLVNSPPPFTLTPRPAPSPLPSLHPRPCPLFFARHSQPTTHYPLPTTHHHHHPPPPPPTPHRSPLTAYTHRRRTAPRQGAEQSATHQVATPRGQRWRRGGGPQASSPQATRLAVAPEVRR